MVVAQKRAMVIAMASTTSWESMSLNCRLLDNCSASQGRTGELDTRPHQTPTYRGEKNRSDIVLVSEEAEAVIQRVKAHTEQYRRQYLHYSAKHERIIAYRVLFDARENEHRARECDHQQPDHRRPSARHTEAPLTASSK